MIRSLKGVYHFLVALVANIRFGFPSRKLTVVGITGTDGKTTTTTLIYDIVKKAGIKASMITSVHAAIAGKTYDTGFHVTTPSAWWVQKYLREALDHGDTHMILEVTSHALSQYRVWGVRFAVGVITNVTHEHLDWHRTFASYMAAKLSLLKNADTAVVNRDEADVYTSAMRFLGRKRYITYGIRRDSSVNPGVVRLKPRIPGEFNKYNCLAAIAAADALGIDRRVSIAAVNGFTGVIGRMETMATRPFRVIVDFAHTPNALEKALTATKAVTRGKLIHVFGSAGLRDRSKRPFMGAASAKYADTVILTEEDYRTEDVEVIMDQIASGITGDVPVVRLPDRREALRYALSLARRGDTVIATGKGHEKSLCRGTTEYPWSDQRELRKLLRKKAG